MIVYDCDDADQFAMLTVLVDEGELVKTRGLQSFAPDVLAEARNRGFHAP